MGALATSWGNVESIINEDGFDGGNLIRTTTTTTYLDANYAKNCANANGYSTEYLVNDIGYEVTDEVWLHCELRMNGPDGVEDDGDGSSMITFYDTNKVPQYRIGLTAAASTSTFAFQRSTDGGTNWTTMGSTFTLSQNILYIIDLQVKIHASTGEAKVYKDGTLTIDFTGDTTSQDNAVRYVDLRSAGDFKYWSQVIVADEYTVGWKVNYLEPTTNGGATGWSGGVTDLTTGIYTGISNKGLHTDTNDTVSTFVLDDIYTGASTLVVDSVFVAARGSMSSGTSVSDLKAVVRIGGTNYDSTDSLSRIINDGSEYSDIVKFGTNPSNGSGWTQADVNGIEAGVRAST